MSLESFQRWLHLCFKPHLNSRSAHKVMRPQNCGSLNFGNFGTPILESRDKMPLDVGLVDKHKIYYKGEGGGFPQIRVVMNVVSPSCSWFVLTPKVLQLCTNHLVFGLCRLM
jgi:hypothetical protein